MHFLLTNDDGVSAIGLKALSGAILESGHTLTVCAPQMQHSAASHHLTLTSPLTVREYPWEGAKAYGIAGTPVDCARLGKYLSPRPIDFVFSGINDGDNAGTSVYYSGTVAAAREARMLNYPSMAVSIMPGADWEMLTHLARLAVRLAEKTQSFALPRLTVLNLNAPALPVSQLKPLRVAPLSNAFFLDSYEMRTNPNGEAYFWLEPGIKTEAHEPDSDMALLHRGHVTLTLLGNIGDANDALPQRLLCSD